MPIEFYILVICIEAVQLTHTLFLISVRDDLRELLERTKHGEQGNE